MACATADKMNRYRDGSFLSLPGNRNEGMPPYLQHFRTSGASVFRKKMPCTWNNLALIIAGIAGRPGARSEGLLRRVLHDHRAGYKADVCCRKRGNLCFGLCFVRFRRFSPAQNSALLKLTSSLYHEDGCFCIPVDYAIGDAAEDRGCQSTSSVGTHDNQICFRPLRLFHNSLDRVSCRDDGL